MQLNRLHCGWSTRNSSIHSRCRGKPGGLYSQWFNYCFNGRGTAYNYQWSNAATGDSISGLVPGSYRVTISDAATCIFPPLTLSANPALTRPELIIPQNNITIPCGQTCATTVASVQG